MLRKVVDTGMFPGTYSTYNVDSYDELLFIPYSKQDNSKIPCLFFPYSRGTSVFIIYAHSNGTDLGELYYNLRRLSQFLAAHVLAFDYPGYGKHAGMADETSVDFCMSAILNYVTSQLLWPTKNIILWGASIGTGPVTRTAKSLAQSKQLLGGLILQCPYRSITHAATAFVPDMVARLLVNQRWNVEEEIVYCNCPVLWIHGKKDEMFDWSGSRKMLQHYEIVNPGKTMGHFPDDVNHVNFDLIIDLVEPIKEFFRQFDLSYYKDAKNLPAYMKMTLNNPQVEKYRPSIDDLISLRFVNVRNKDAPWTSIKDWIHGDKSLESSDDDELKHLYQAELSLNLYQNTIKSDKFKTLYSYIYKSFVLFMDELRYESDVRGLWNLKNAKLHQVFNWVWRFYYLRQPSLFVDAVFVREGDRIWTLAILIVSGVSFKLEKDVVSGCLKAHPLIQKNVVNNKCLHNIYPPPKHLILPIFTPPKPDLKDVAFWLIDTFDPRINAKFIRKKQLILAKHIARNIIKELNKMKRRPLFEFLIDSSGSWHPFGWDQMISTIFGEATHWFLSRLLLHDGPHITSTFRHFPNSINSHNFKFNSSQIDTTRGNSVTIGDIILPQIGAILQLALKTNFSLKKKLPYDIVNDIMHASHVSNRIKAHISRCSVNKNFDDSNQHLSSQGLYPYEDKLYCRSSSLPSIEQLSQDLIGLKPFQNNCNDNQFKRSNSSTLNAHSASIDESSGWELVDFLDTYINYYVPKIQFFKRIPSRIQELAHPELCKSADACSEDTAGEEKLQSSAENTGGRQSNQATAFKHIQTCKFDGDVDLCTICRFKCNETMLNILQFRQCTSVDDVALITLFCLAWTDITNRPLSQFLKQRKTEIYSGKHKESVFSYVAPGNSLFLKMLKQWLIRLELSYFSTMSADENKSSIHNQVPQSVQNYLATLSLVAAYVRWAITDPFLIDKDGSFGLNWQMFRMSDVTRSRSDWDTAIHPFESQNPCMQQLEAILSAIMQFFGEYDIEANVPGLRDPRLSQFNCSKILPKCPAVLINKSQKMAANVYIKSKYRELATATKNTISNHSNFKFNYNPQKITESHQYKEIRSRITGLIDRINYTKSGTMKEEKAETCIRSEFCGQATELHCSVSNASTDVACAADETCELDPSMLSQRAAHAT